MKFRRKYKRKYRKKLNQSTVRLQCQVQTWFVSSVRMSTSSIKKILGESVLFDIYTSEVGAKDWMNIGCFNHSFDIYAPLYPYFLSVSTNLSSNFLPSTHFTCYGITRSISSSKIITKGIFNSNRANNPPNTENMKLTEGNSFFINAT